MNPGDGPELTYLLSSEGRSPEPVQPLTQVTPQPGEAEAWEGTFALPADAGLNEVETFHFIYSGADDLANVSQAVLCSNLFQVYQGALPPLSPPLSLKAESLPGGAIRLTWSDVAGAVGYQVYRRSPGETELTPLVRLGTVLTHTDSPSEDGTYRFAVASIRQENSQESLSGMSEQVSAVSDGTPPNPPLNLTLQLVAQGIMATWQPPVFTEPVTYSLYRDDVSEITTVAGLAPLAGGINQTTVIDPHPSPTDHAYVVTAVDGVGNVSVPSNSFYLNFQLLPISSLTVLQVDEDAPIITWTHPGGSIAGYDLYLGSGASLMKVNDTLLTTLTYTDAGYAGDARRYTVIAKDTTGHESVARSLTLPVSDGHPL